MAGRHTGENGSNSRPGRGLLAAAVLALAGSPATAAEAGRTLYESRCQSCHRSVSDFADMEPAQLAAELAAPTVRKHRFRLSPAEQEALRDYLLPDR